MAGPQLNSSSYKGRASQTGCPPFPLLHERLDSMNDINLGSGEQIPMHPDADIMAKMNPGPFGRRRIIMAVSVDLDPMSGTFNQPEDHVKGLSWALNDLYPHYKPTVVLLDDGEPIEKTPEPETLSRFDKYGGYYSARFSGIEFARFAPSDIWSEYATRMKETAGDFTYAFVATDMGEPAKTETEKMYLVCECGEAFDSLEAAAAHITLVVDGVEDHEFVVPTDIPFNIVPESEAM